MKIDTTDCAKTKNLATSSDMAHIAATLNTPLMQKIKTLSSESKALVSGFIDSLLV